MARVHLVINAGSSSLKFQVFLAEGADEPERIYRGQFDGLGSAPHFKVSDANGPVAEERWPDAAGFGHEEALAHLGEWLRGHSGGHHLVAVGHRVVHGGMDFTGPVRITPQVMEALEKLSPLAPLHQPHNLEPIRIVARRAPHLPQVASFDTAFHRNQPELAQRFALPRKMTESGVRRYGFHGLSYAYLASAFPGVDARLARGRVVAAHLGNGASLCALDAGRSVATTMGFSALDGLPMGTRCGALDPAVVFHMLREMRMTAEEAEHLLYSQSGLLGVSGLSNDMRELRTLAASEPHAREAIDLFVYRIGREIGSLTAALGGIDAIVFTAGIGENDAETRAEVIAAARWAGFELDPEANAAGATVITRGPGPAAFIIPTDEERMIARDMRQVLAVPAALPEAAH